MRTTIGIQYAPAQSSTAPQYVYWDSDALVNPHMILLGGSGMGKSHMLRKMITNGTGPKVRFHVFDVHGDMDMPGESVIEFSEQSEYGLNPLVVNPHHRFGGVRKCVESFIRTVNQVSSRELGIKQESVLRNLLYDVFADFGFLPDDPSTWAVNELEVGLLSSGRDNRLYLTVPFAEKDAVQALGARWDGAKKHWWIAADRYEGALTKWKPAIKPRTYPSIKDVAHYCNQLYTERFLGSEQEAMRLLNNVNRKAKALNRKKLEALKNGQVDLSVKQDTEELTEAKEASLEAYSRYVEKITTGEELGNLLKYDSAEVLKSVLDRLEGIISSGVFSAKSPDFDMDSYIWRYKLDALYAEEKKMLVLFMLQKLFRDAVQRGQQKNLIDVIVLDELGTFTSSADNGEGDGIIGTIAREARKFGLGLWGAHQQLNGVPESMLSSVGTTIILGLSEIYWPSAVTKLRIETKQLKFIQPHKTLCAQLKEKGSLRMNWRWLNHTN